MNVRSLLIALTLQAVEISEMRAYLNRFSHRTLQQDKVMTENQVSYFFTKLSDTCHSYFSSHLYHHTVAIELMQKPEQNSYVTQKLLGHHDIKVTLRYYWTQCRDAQKLRGERLRE